MASDSALYRTTSWLRWKARSQAILTILKNLGADFLCLQEVDEYDGFYKGKMEILGYSGLYIQRSGQKRDGCGIFYKQDRAELVLEEKMDYNDLVSPIEDYKDGSANKDSLEQSNGDRNIHKNPASTNAPENRGDPNDPRVRLKRDCVGILAAFRLKDLSRHVIVVANTHIYWDPKWADVKLAQAKYLLSRLAQFRDLVSDKFDCIPAVIVAGDFNSTPGDEVYQCLVSGDLTSTIPEIECSDDLPIPLRSVYASTGGEPSFTNCTPDFTGTLDYIFFCPSSDIKPISFLELPGSNSEEVVGGLPNYYHPSDHLPIGAEFELDCDKVC
ncbi:carbon catabolite repressor protein 4 homolog 4 isoform X2 [Rhodamnia argentea]|uniref:Carbon catabolite repressor protein 4 homolog 4 isoform X2 n=1 Tax=Rhodamnia argentea TaxID=178133 RepID=A0A8B8R3V5_9MYRT|nr:carbon catabolite repressor protein 4 homolog 4 isoform X2 [Rhodamnia argentea]